MYLAEGKASQPTFNYQASPPFNLLISTSSTTGKYYFSNILQGGTNSKLDMQERDEIRSVLDMKKTPGLNNYRLEEPRDRLKEYRQLLAHHFDSDRRRQNMFLSDFLAGPAGQEFEADGSSLLILFGHNEVGAWDSETLLAISPSSRLDSEPPGFQSYHCMRDMHRIRDLQIDVIPSYPPNPRQEPNCAEKGRGSQRDTVTTRV